MQLQNVIRIWSVKQNEYLCLCLFLRWIQKAVYISASQLNLLKYRIIEKDVRDLKPL